MLNFILSPFGFTLLLSFFLLGAGGSLLFRKHDHLANVWGNALAIGGSVWGLIFSVTSIVNHNSLTFTAFASPFPLLTFSISVDLLSAFFLLIISLITLFTSIYALGYVKHYYKKYNLGALGFLYNLFILGMLLVVTASNGLFFLMAWEIMSVASYFLVVYDRADEKNIKAGYLYLSMTHAGTAFIILAFLLLYKFTGSFEFEAIKSGAILLPAAIKDLIFVLALLGFGTKAGIVPLHIWLPAAHPAAPSHVSALMSGVMIKTGIFMMIRLFLDLLQPIPVWWGLVLLIIGSTSTLLGVLYALTEHDLKKLLAYHSIENVGIILLGLGSAMTFLSLGRPTLALLGLIAALFHTLNHAIFKSLLFLSAGSVINETHTRNMEEYGGLIKHMPLTAGFFLIGAMAISALPPFNGFFSEWLTFQALFQGMIELDFFGRWIFMLAAGALAFTGGLALACFVKAFGVTFLARPRSAEVTHAKESTWPLLVGMGALASLSILCGIFSAQLTAMLEQIGSDLGIFDETAAVTMSLNASSLSVAHGFSAVSGPAFFVLLLSITLLVVLASKIIINRRQKVTTGPTWDCGTDLTPRMEITATGFSRSIILIFKGILKPSLQRETQYHDAHSRYLPPLTTVTLGVGDIYQTYFYQPLAKIVTALSSRVKNIQSGNINVYISYIFLALLVTLIATL